MGNFVNLTAMGRFSDATFNAKPELLVLPAYETEASVQKQSTKCAVDEVVFIFIGALEIYTASLAQFLKSNSSIL